MDKSLKKIKRAELLELLLAVSQENEKLKEKISKLENQIEEQTLIVSEKGIIGEVTIKINGMLEDIEKIAQIRKFTENANKELFV
ncbi:MAG: hypothetical protein ACRDA3_12805 [Peptostreptococcaceae bacterium]